MYDTADQKKKNTPLTHIAMCVQTAHANSSQIVMAAPEFFMRMTSSQMIALGTYISKSGT